jgi:prepilin peptidase CpaA
MPHPFFPLEPAFAWVYCLALVGLTAAASYTDLRRLTIPKVLTLSTLGLGIIMNLLRGAGLGADGHAVWLFQEPGAVLGAFDGLLFSLAGFATGFGLFFVMWILGTCGGGDLKLFAALGAWVGPTLAVLVLISTLILVVVFAVARLAWSFVTRGYRPTAHDYTLQGAAKSGKRSGKGAAAEARRTRQRLMAYSLPVAVSTALVLAWVFRGELRLAQPGGSVVPHQPDAPARVMSVPHQPDAPARVMSRPSLARRAGMEARFRAGLPVPVREAVGS